MAITRIKNSTISNRTPKYNDVLAGLPYRPIIGTATDGGNGTSVSVAFTGNNVANGTITYTALSSPGSFTGTGTASPITVSGLTTGTAYTFQVKAGNSLGDSAYSAASNSVTPVTPTAFDSIASTTASGGETSITFSSISGSYQHLQIRATSRRGANGAALIGIRLNSDTGSNYAWHRLGGDGTATDAGGLSGGSYMYGPNMPSSTNSANIFGTAIIDIHDYASSTKNKTVRFFGGYDDNGSGYIYLTSGLWLSTATVTSVTVYFGGDTVAAGSTYSLYGIKG